MNPLHMLQSQYILDCALFLNISESSKSLSSKPLYSYQQSMTPYHLMAFQAHAIKMAQLNAVGYRNDISNVKSELSLKAEAKCEYIPKPTKIEESEDLSPHSEPLSTPPLVLAQELSPIDLKPELEKMTRFLLANMGKDNQTLIEYTRNYYSRNPSLLEIYNKMTMKYYSAKKCKEDIIRYILRKAFRKIRTSIMQEEKVSSKKAGLLLCKRYFQSNTAQLTGEETEEEILESLMPYNKNSKNKTMNINFVLQIFSSESFCRAYQEFLPELNTIMIKENQEKEEKLIGFLLGCIQKKCINKLGTVHRLPWTDVWIEDAKNLAIAIMPNKRLIYNSKRPKY